MNFSVISIFAFVWWIYGRLIGYPVQCDCRAVLVNVFRSFAAWIPYFIKILFYCRQGIWLPGDIGIIKAYNGYIFRNAQSFLI